VPIKAFSDNYIWCLRNETHCVVVDPGDPAPVLAYCQAQQLQLSGILITHHHWDHTGGLDDLLKAFAKVAVYGPTNASITQIEHRLVQGDTVFLEQLDVKLSVIEVPGHTLDHIAYYSQPHLFCGDTLFSAGCGRLFEGTPKQMFDSLAKLSALPADTAVYCTHEYTLANIAFAQAAEGNHHALVQYKEWAQAQRQQGLPTLPSSIQMELAINPFLRCQQRGLIDNLELYTGLKLDSDESVFAALRSWKDSF
jgi:hydroxyacylglutathione hydrolase